MPRKLPSRMKFEKYERYTTYAPAQRISTSSVNSIRNDESTNSARIRVTTEDHTASPGCSSQPLSLFRVIPRDVTHVGD